MTVNCSARIKKKKVENQLFLCLVHLHLAIFRVCFFSILFSPHNFFPCVLQSSFFFFSFSFISLSMPSSLGYFILCCELGLPPHHGFCFLSQVHMAHIQIASGWARPPVCWIGQPALQTGLRRQDQQSTAGSGGAHQAAVKGGQLELTGWSWAVLRPDGKEGISGLKAISATVLSLELEFRKLHIYQHSPNPANIFCD